MLQKSSQAGQLDPQNYCIYRVIIEVKTLYKIMFMLILWTFGCRKELVIKGFDYFSNELILKLAYCKMTEE